MQKEWQFRMPPFAILNEIMDLDQNLLKANGEFHSRWMKMIKADPIDKSKHQKDVRTYTSLIFKDAC